MTDPLGKRSSEPSTFAFSVDGDLVGQDLQWSGWGSDPATATGTLVERTGGSLKTVPVEGTVTLRGLTDCRGARYYARANVTVPASAPFQPGAITLGSPCE